MDSDDDIPLPDDDVPNSPPPELFMVNMPSLDSLPGKRRTVSAASSIHTPVPHTPDPAGRSRESPDIMILYESVRGTHPSNAHQLVSFSKSQPGLEEITMSQAMTLIAQWKMLNEGATMDLESSSSEDEGDEDDEDDDGSERKVGFYSTDEDNEESDAVGSLHPSLAAALVSDLDEEPVDDVDEYFIQKDKPRISRKATNIHSVLRLSAKGEAPTLELGAPGEVSITELSDEELDFSDVVRHRLVSPSVSKSTSMSTSSASSSADEQYISLDAYLLRFCAEPGTVSEESGSPPSDDPSLVTLYRDAALLFARRIAGTLLMLLCAIEALIRDGVSASAEQKSGLLKFLEHWLQHYPGDFENNEEMQGKLIEIQTTRVVGSDTYYARRITPRDRRARVGRREVVAPVISSSDTPTAESDKMVIETDPSLRVVRSLDSPKPGKITLQRLGSHRAPGSGGSSVTDSYAAAGLFDAQKRCWISWKNSWMSIESRQKIDSIPLTYLSKPDTLIIKDKLSSQSESSGKVKSLAKKRDSKAVGVKGSVMRLYRREKIKLTKGDMAVKTIEWREEIPEFYTVGQYLSDEESDSSEDNSDDEAAGEGGASLPDPMAFLGKGGGLDPSVLLAASGLGGAASDISAVASLKKKQADRDKLVASRQRTRTICKIKSKTSGQFLHHSIDTRDVSEARATLDKQRMQWDMTWPWLTLYFECTFPKNLMSVELCPRHVAEALTVLKYQLFLKIQPREFENRGWKGSKNKRKSKNIRKMIEMFETEAHWAQMILLSEQRHAARSFKLKRLLKICDELIDLGNYDSACAIRYGIFEKYIMNLPMENLSKNGQELLAKLSKFDDFSHRNVKMLTANRMKQGLTMVPLLSVVLEKLYKIEEVWKPTKDGKIYLKWMKGMYDACQDMVFSVQRIKVGPSGFVSTPKSSVGGLSASSAAGGGHSTTASGPVISPITTPTFRKGHSHASAVSSGADSGFPLTSALDRSQMMFYSGITKDRRDIQLLIISEIKEWCSISKEKMHQMADFQMAISAKVLPPSATVQTSKPPIPAHQSAVSASPRAGLGSGLADASSAMSTLRVRKGSKHQKMKSMGAAIGLSGSSRLLK